MVLQLYGLAISVEESVAQTYFDHNLLLHARYLVYRNRGTRPGSLFNEVTILDRRPRCERIASYACSPLPCVGVRSFPVRLP